MFQGEYQLVAATTFFPNFLKFWTLLSILFCLGWFGFLNSVFPLLQIWIFEVELRSTVFIHFGSRVIQNCQCFSLWNLTFFFIFEWFGFIAIGGQSKFESEIQLSMQPPFWMTNREWADGQFLLSSMRGFIGSNLLALR